LRRRENAALRAAHRLRSGLRHKEELMFKQLLQVCAVVSTVAGVSELAHAGSPYGGSVEDAYKCDPELKTFDTVDDHWKWLDEVIKSGKGMSPACKAVFEQRLEVCLKAPDMQWKLKDPEYTKGIPGRPCHQDVWAGIDEQVMYDRQLKKQAEDDAKAKAERDAKAAAEVAARELPKAIRHDAKLEKAIEAAYHKDYPEGKVLKVILGDWDEELEKDAFGNVTGHDLDATVVNKQADGKCYLHDEYWMQRGNGRSYSGPFSARGAGSASDNEILCGKVEAPAKAAPKKK
jgi:hypothetical protein